MPEKKAKNERGDFVPNPCDEPREDSKRDEEQSDEKQEQINEVGSVITCHKDKIIHCLTIIGQIEGHYILSSQNKTTKYEHIIPLLVSVEEDPRIDGLLILLNTGRTLPVLLFSSPRSSLPFGLKPSTRIYPGASCG